MKNIFLAFMVIFLGVFSAKGQDAKLSGTVIGTEKSVDYGTNTASTTVNTRECAFDGNLNTYFAAYDRSYAWVGLDLGAPHIITRIGWAPANRNKGDERILLGVFEGANSADFMDALPLYIITEKGTLGKMDFADIVCSKGFRYVRYVGPSDQQCNIAELEFYGHAGQGDESNLYRLTNLPTVSIHTENNVEPKDKKNNINALITIINEKGNKVQTDSGTVRLRGNKSMSFPKKPYRIKFNKKQKVLDASAKAKKWTLINNYGDKTLMRNLLAFELSRCLNMPYTPYGKSVDVLLNGEYKGNYQLCDQVEVNKNRVNLDETIPEGEESLPATAFLIEADGRASTSEECWFKSDRSTLVTIHYPDEDEITPAQKQYIKDCYNALEEDWLNNLDLNTFIGHFLVGELSGNTDTYWSTYMYKHRMDNKIYVGPVWDFDIAFENDQRTYPINSKTDYVYRSGGSYTGYMRTFVDNIVIRHTGAKAELLKAWGKAREDGLNEAHLVDFINQQEENLQESQQLNFMRWPIMNKKVHENPTVWGSYAAEVQNVRQYIIERLTWMDNKLGYTYNPSGIRNATVNFDQPYQIYDLSGRSYTGNVQHLPQGLYIVKQGSKTKKIQVK